MKPIKLIGLRGNINSSRFALQYIRRKGGLSDVIYRVNRCNRYGVNHIYYPRFDLVGNVLFPEKARLPPQPSEGDVQSIEKQPRANFRRPEGDSRVYVRPDYFKLRPHKKPEDSRMKGVMQIVIAFVIVFGSLNWVFGVDHGAAFGFSIVIMVIAVVSDTIRKGIESKKVDKQATTQMQADLNELKKHVGEMREYLTDLYIQQHNQKEHNGLPEP
jgi:hypothetical protein